MPRHYNSFAQTNRMQRHRIVNCVPPCIGSILIPKAAVYKHLRQRMDSKSPAKKAPPITSRSKSPSARRRRLYTLLSIPLILALGFYAFYPKPTDQEPRPFPNPRRFYTCNTSGPVKRIAVIGTATLSQAL